MSKPDTTKLTIRLPREQVQFVKRFAKANGLTVTEVISRYLERLQEKTPEELSPEVQWLVGLIPEDADLDATRLEYLLEKHGR
jgi:hypothetical protein